MRIQTVKCYLTAILVDGLGKMWNLPPEPGAPMIRAQVFSPPERPRADISCDTNITDTKVKNNIVI